MDVIYEAAANFFALEDYEYRFVVSKNRTTSELKVDFRDSDFFHLAGLHYLTDISLPQNRKETIKNILEKKNITDELIHKSRFYTDTNPDRDIKSRMEELRFLEEYLDVDNFIKIYSTRNDKYINSRINADYIIESQFKGSPNSIYIFLKRRDEDPQYLCVESFFKKSNITYGGDKLYWMLKEKITPQGKIELFRNKNYKN